VPFDIKIIWFSVIFVLPWKKLHAHLGHFCQHCNSKIVEDFSTKHATHIKQEAQMCLLILKLIGCQ